MSKFIGRLVDVGIGKESVRGTVVVPSFWIPKMEFTHDDKIEQVIDESSVGVIEDAQDASVISKFSEGSIKGRTLDKSFGLWLLAALGQVSSATKSGETIVKEHTFTVKQDSQHPSLTVSVKDPNVGTGLQYALSVINTLEFNIELGKYIEYTIVYRGKKKVLGSVTPSYTQENFWLPQHGEFKHAISKAGLAAATPVNIKRFNFTITKNVEDDRVIGNVDQIDILNRAFTVEGSIELHYEDIAFVDFLLNDASRAIQIALTNPDVIIGVSSNPKLLFEFAKVKLSEVARTQDNNEIVRQTLSFKSFYSLSDAQSLRAILTNLQVSY